MEINQHNFVSVEERDEEREEALQRKRLSAVDSVDSETSTGIPYDSPKKSVEIEDERRLHNGVACVDLETASGVDYESPNKSIHQTNSVYFDQQHGTESIDGALEMNNGGITSSNFGDAHVNNVKNSKMKESLIAEMCSKTLESSLVEQNIKAKSVHNETKLVETFDSLEENEQEKTEFDVEKVLEKQNTHDLYCPNCNSCITRRVILRRKRKFGRKPKYSKVEATFSSELDAASATSANVQIHQTVDAPSSDSAARAATNQNGDGEAEVFRCLSCFSFFIPTGDGFKLFRRFGDSNHNENLQNIQKIPETNTNWFLSLFTTDKKKMAVEQAGARETLEDALLGPLHGGVNSPVSLAVIDMNSSTAMPENQSTQNGHASIVSGTQLSMKLPGAGQILTDSAVVHHESMKDAMFSSSQAIPILQKETAGVEEAAFSDIKKKDTGHEVILVIDRRSPDPAGSETETARGNEDSVEASSLLQSGMQTNISEQRNAGLAVDILKSIVYGGLVESITSLGVVSSAAGAGSATLNIVALGLANLIGGLLIIGHNLIELKNNTSGGSSSQTTEGEDRYQETLGRRENFKLHATVAILSFLIFGMLAPCIYGFSFRESDDRDLKLAVVGVASFVCIVLLSIGKARVRRPPKSYIRTALYYVSTGVMASGVSYVVGDLISKLMAKLGWFESSLGVTMVVPERKPVELAWAFY